MSKKKKFLLALLVVLVILQFIPIKKNDGSATGPMDITTKLAVSPELMNTLQLACFDCHSDHTDYPWYSKIQPVGFWLAHHVDEGKRELNFSQFASYTLKRQVHKLREIKKEIGEGEMPLSSYTIIHTNAKLSPEQLQLLNNWVDSSLISLGAPLAEPK